MPRMTRSISSRFSFAGISRTGCLSTPERSGIPRSILRRPSPKFIFRKQVSMIPARKTFWEDHSRLDSWHGLKSFQPLELSKGPRGAIYPASAALRTASQDERREGDQWDKRWPDSRGYVEAWSTVRCEIGASSSSWNYKRVHICNKYQLQISIFDEVMTGGSLNWWSRGSQCSNRWKTCRRTEYGAWTSHLSSTSLKQSYLLPRIGLRPNGLYALSEPTALIEIDSATSRIIKGINRSWLFSMWRGYQ